MAEQELRVAWEEVHVPQGEELEIHAPSAEHVRIIDVTQVGNELRYRYVVIWENGNGDSEGSA